MVSPDCSGLNSLNVSAITAEYGYRINDYYVETEGTKYYDTFSIGYELETGGHVFQIFFANSYGIVESQFLRSYEYEVG
jgi:hypothetical protein